MQNCSFRLSSARSWKNRARAQINFLSVLKLTFLLTFQASQNACSSLCDEIVTLWKLAALNPCISPRERNLLRQRLINYHITVIEKIQANSSSASTSSASSNSKTGKYYSLMILFFAEIYPVFRTFIKSSDFFTEWIHCLAKTWIYLTPYVCTERFFDSRSFMYNKIFFKKLS